MFQTTNQSVSICRWLNISKSLWKLTIPDELINQPGVFLLRLRRYAATPLRLFPGKHLSVGTDDLPQAILGVVIQQVISIP